MPSLLDQLTVYLYLTRTISPKIEPMDRDRLTLIGGALAVELGLYRIANFCRQMVLDHNQGHMLRKFDTMSEALYDEDYQHFLKTIRKRFTFEQAEALLEKIGIDWRGCVSESGDPEESAARILGVTKEWLKKQFMNA